MSSFNKDKVNELKRTLEGKSKEAKSFSPTAPETTSNEENSPELLGLQTALNAAQEEAKQNYDKLLRVMAEFENYKKRVAKDHLLQVKYAHETILKELLGVLDDFDRILEHLPESTDPGLKGLVEGAELTHRHLLKIVQQFGLKEIQTEGRLFDPHLHEAIAHAHSDTHAEGVIVHCHRKGYQLHERLLRAAVVTIAKVKPQENEK